MSTTTDPHSGTHMARPGVLVLTVLGLLLASCDSSGGGAGGGHTNAAVPSAPAAVSVGVPPAPSAPAAVSVGVPPAPGLLAPASTPAPDGYKLLKTSPESGFVGASLTITGQSLPANKPVTFTWVTEDGSYAMNVLPDTVQYTDRKFVERRVVLAPSSGGAVVDAEGHLSATFVAPDDYGGIHEIYAVVDGQEVGKAGYALLRHVTVSPLSGPVGTPMSISVNGLGWKPYESTMSILWDNRYTGFLAATTTRGTISGVIRATGPAGKHSIEVGGASAAVPYLNWEQSPVAQFPNYSFTFTVTADAGAPPNTLDWPDDRYLAVNPSARTTGSAGASLVPGISTTLSPTSGPVNSAATLQAAGLPASVAVDLAWVSAVGNRVSPSGWTLQNTPLGQNTTGADGSLTATIKVPDDVGGWHSLRLLQSGNVLAEAPYFVQRSLVSVTPARVKAGEDFTVELKGVGWTELDNGVAVDYDNGYMGYACGFNSHGDVMLHLKASGDPGTHLIDIYPMVFQGQGKPPWDYQLPILGFKQDAPGLSLGYRLPAYRLAIEVVP